jgi:hypothetical protein
MLGPDGRSGEHIRVVEPSGLQAAAELSEHLVERVLRDRDDNYSPAFDADFQAEEMDVLKSAPGAPRVNAHHERIIRTKRSELRDHILTLNTSHAREIRDVLAELFDVSRRTIGNAVTWVRPLLEDDECTSTRSATRYSETAAAPRSCRAG